jgi:ABC-type transport system substrate-binding protein
MPQRLARSITRRRLLILLGVGAATAGLSAACQPAPASPTPPPAAAPTTAKPAQAAPPTTTTPTASSASNASNVSTASGTIRAGQTLNFTSMDPHQSRSGGDRQAFYLLYNPLVDIGPDLSIQPALAEKWDTPDDKTIVFTLRRDVKFHDGTDFNADAVKFNFDRLLDKANNSPVAAQVAEIAATEVVDPVHRPLASVASVRAAAVRAHRPTGLHDLADGRQGRRAGLR